MANKLSISRSTYANYESNKREPNTDIIYKICEIFDISVHELIGEYTTNSFNTDLFHRINSYERGLVFFITELPRYNSFTIYENTCRSIFSNSC